MSRPVPPPRELSSLEILASKLSDDVVPNFEKAIGVLFDTFVRPDGPALLLVSHYYHTGRGFSKDPPTQDPTEQMNWCKQNLGYFSPAVKFIARLRNKLAHKAYVSPELLKSLARELSDLEVKGSNGGYLLESIISKLGKALRLCLGDRVTSANVTLVCENCKRPFIQEPPRMIMTLDHGLPTLKDIKSDLLTKEKIKGRTVMIVGGTWNNKVAIFRSWSGTTAYMDIQDIGRRSVRLNTVVRLME